MKTDIEIAQAAELTPITEVARQIGIEQDDLEVYGRYKAKLSEEYIEKIGKNPEGKLILVTAINPTPAGEGKTTVTVGLGHQRRCSRRRLFPGGADGGFKPPFYGRLSRNHIRQQSAGGAFGQSHPAGKSAAYRYKTDYLEEMPGHE